MAPFQFIDLGQSNGYVFDNIGATGRANYTTELELQHRSPRRNYHLQGEYVPLEVSADRECLLGGTHMVTGLEVNSKKFSSQPVRDIAWRLSIPSPMLTEGSTWIMKHVLFILLACTLLAPESFAEDKVLVPAEQSGVQRGDQWSYNLTDDVTGDLKATYTYVVSDVDDKVIVTRVSKRGQDGAPGSATYDVHWNLIDDNLWKRKPHDGTGINGPLKIGSEWRSRSTAENSKVGIVLRVTSKSKVVGEEEVTTQAGNILDIQNCNRNAASQYGRSVETLNVNYNSMVRA